MKNDIDGTPDISETVDIIASGYEWICPDCGCPHKEIEWKSKVVCKMIDCKHEFETNPPEHTYRK